MQVLSRHVAHKMLQIGVMTMWIPVTSIAPSRTKLQEHKVRKHMQDIEAGHEPRAIDVARINTGYTVAGNGRHRLEAYRRLGFDLILVTVVNG